MASRPNPFQWKHSQKTTKFFFWLFVVCGALAMWKIVHILTVEDDGWQEVKNAITKKDFVIKPKRGTIFGTNGEILAATMEEYELYLDFDYLERDEADVKRRAVLQFKRDSTLHANLDEMCDSLVKMFPDINKEELKKNILTGREQNRAREKKLGLAKGSINYFKFFPRNVTYLQLQKIRKDVPYLNLPRTQTGFHADAVPTRLRPYGELAVRTVGNLSQYDHKPTCGLEQFFDSLLTGTQGVYHVEKDGKGFTPVIDVPAVDGCDIVTTLDMDIQDICENALKKRLTELEAISGVCIMMQPSTGDIVAMVSLQRYGDRFLERTNRALTTLYPPGSVFKPVSLLIGFDDGFLHLTDRVDCCGGIISYGNRQMKDEGYRGNNGNQSWDVATILEKSSNIGVSQLIWRNYKNQQAKYLDGLKRVGITERIELPLVGCQTPRIKDFRVKKDDWYPTTLPWMSIGYENLIPPINTLAFYNGLANGGRLMKPRLVKEVRHGGQVVETYEPVALRERMASPEAVKAVETCLTQVVHSPTGTGKRARSRHFTTAGKTGTAQIWERGHNSGAHWLTFVGYFPVESPRYSCIVCIEKTGGGGGGTASAPVFREISETVMALAPLVEIPTDENAARLPLVAPGNVKQACSVLQYLGIPDPCATAAKEGAPTWGFFQTGSQKIAVSSDISGTSSDAGGLRMPELHGYGLRDALFRLESLGLRVKTSGVGYVSAQSVAPGTPVRPGSVVSLRLSMNGEAKNADFIGDFADSAAHGDTLH